MACYTIKEAKELWDYAKDKYLKQPGPHGYPDFKELTNNLSDDIYRTTGRRVVPEEVAKMLATPKAVRGQRQTLLLADRNRQRALRQARDFVAGQEQSPLERFLRGAYQAPYAGKVVGHQAALHMTHAWPYAFDPLMWKNFGKSWLHSWQSMSESNARGIAQSIMLDPRFDEKVNSGLSVDPRKVYDDVQHRAGFWGKLGRMLGNSFLGLKELRSMGWDTIYDRAPEHLRTQELRDLISNNVNHMTGAPGRSAALALSGKFGEAARGIAFAPSLDVARVMRPVDLLQSGQTMVRHYINQAPLIGEQMRKLWHEASPEQQFVAKENIKQWMRIAGTGATILYLNHLLLKHFFGNTGEDVNVTDPFSPDWGAAKAPDGSILQATGGEVPLMRMVIRSVAHPKEAPNIVGNYILGKLHPFLASAYVLAKGWGFGGEDVPAPFGAGPPTAAKWAEFLLSEFGPISTEEGIHEFAKRMSNETGVPEDFASKFIKSLAVAAAVSVPAALGTHYYKPTVTPKGSRGGGRSQPAVISAPGR